MAKNTFRDKASHDAFKLARLKERVAAKRKKGESVIDYALANGKAFRFLTTSEKDKYHAEKKQREQQKAAKEKVELLAVDAALFAWKNTAAMGVDDSECHRRSNIAYQATLERLNDLNPSLIEREEKLNSDRGVLRAEFIKSAFNPDSHFVQNVNRTHDYCN